MNKDSTRSKGKRQTNQKEYAQMRIAATSDPSASLHANRPLFRLMTLDDIPGILAIENEAFAGHHPWSEDAFEQELKNNSLAYYLVMLDGDDLIGYGGMWIILDEAHITNIAMHAGYRGQGLGSCLVEQMQALARLYGAESMTLEVRPSNVVAQHVYEKCGFTSAGRRPGYYEDGEDAVIMWATIKRPTGK